jgi:hypothetical protein
MNLNKIFLMFGYGGDDKGDSKKMKEEFNLYKNTPYFKIGMFHKLITNGNNFSQQVLKFFLQADPTLDAAGIDEAGEYMMYTRAWYWISQCKLRRKEWKEALINHASDEFIVSIKLSIHYFESIEEYEKCAFLKKIQDFTEKNLPK